MRLWRRVRIAPGVTINLSKSGPSVSLGPRGAKVTMSRRGVRQTVGIPGTGVYATRQLTSPSPRPVSATPPDAPTLVGQPADAAAELTTTPGDDQMELYYGFATLTGIALGVALLALGQPAEVAVAGAFLAIVGGIAYEGLAHHHPGPAKRLAQVVVALVAVATAIGAAILIAVAAGAVAGSRTSSRRRRR